MSSALSVDEAVIWPLEASRQSKVIVSPEETCRTGGMLCRWRDKKWDHSRMRMNGAGQQDVDADLLSQARWHWERLTA